MLCAQQPSGGYVPYFLNLCQALRRIEKEPFGQHKVILNVLKSIISGVVAGPARMQSADAGDPSKARPGALQTLQERERSRRLLDRLT